MTCLNKVCSVMTAGMQQQQQQLLLLLLLLLLLCMYGAVDSSMAVTRTVPHTQPGWGQMVSIPAWLRII
jgi:hypothetical protein